MIEFIYKVKKFINSNGICSNYMKVVFLPNFSVSLCELLVSAADLSQHISAPGTEVRYFLIILNSTVKPSGTSNLKYIMNGCLLVGSRDGVNLEIEKEVGQQNMFIFGSEKNRLYAYLKFVSLLPERFSD